MLFVDSIYLSTLQYIINPDQTPGGGWLIIKKLNTLIRNPRMGIFIKIDAPYQIYCITYIHTYIHIVIVISLYMYGNFSFPLKKFFLFFILF